MPCHTCNLVNSSLEDPRLVRIENYEEGVTGRHDAAKLLTPFVDAYLKNSRTHKSCCTAFGHGITQQDHPNDSRNAARWDSSLTNISTVFYNSTDDVDTHLFTSLPFDIYNIHSTFGHAESSF